LPETQEGELPAVQLYDTTLRDGAQREGISFSAVDKLHIAQKLDELGIHFIEGGWPGSNPKDAEFFEKAKNIKFANSSLVAFGSTRHSRAKAETDANLKALENSGAKIVTIVGKSSELQVTQVLETTLDNNLEMIADSIRYLKSKGLAVFFDAEHFFDGFKANPAYTLRVLNAAAEAGADCLVLCDTNGGTLPDEIKAAVDAAVKSTTVPLGIHAHNDSELAVANSLAAVQAGVTQIQGTINGYGERCGNANLCSIIATLKLKMGIDCITDKQLARLSEVSHYVSEVANLVPDPFLPYVGASAFSHKGGLHVSALSKWTESYQHLDPARVGNQQRVVISELSGKKNIIYKARELGLDLPSQGKEAQKLLEQVKLLESHGFQYDNAEASFELLLHRAKSDYNAPFELVDFMVVVERRRRQSIRKSLGEMMSEAIVKVKVGTEIIHTAAEGDGPVNALDKALRKALLQFYPHLAPVKLVDYKVRILVALADSLEYWLLKHEIPVDQSKKD